MRDVIASAFVDEMQKIAKRVHIAKPPPFFKRHLSWDYIKKNSPVYQGVVEALKDKFGTRGKVLKSALKLTKDLAETFLT